MFSSGAGTSRSQQGSSVPPRPFFFPTRFIWPNGGRRVYLSGSFTRWTEGIPMSPMEGCPTVFQVVCNLTPGYHQYKFNVDGDWRHNVDQPYVTGNLGVVNTVFLAGQPDIVPSSFSQDTSMDVDNDDFTHMEVAPRISMADLELSRNRISVFLSRQTAYEMLPESGKVPALDVTVPMKEAFHILHDEQVPVIPLWDSDKGQFVGVLSALDFILILRELGNRGSNLTEEQLKTYTLGEWKEGKLNLNRQLDRNGRCYPPHLISAGPHDSLKEVAVKIVQNNVATVPIIHTQSKAGSYPKLLYLATLSEILKCICRQFRHTSSSLPILQHPISEFHIGTRVPNIGESDGRPLAMVRPNTSLADTLSLMIQAEVSSVPIVDDNYSLLDVYSRCDITALAQYKAYTQIRLNQLTVHETLQYGRFANYPIGFHGGRRCQMCLQSDPLLKVMERLAIPGVRRLVVVEAGSKRVEGIISLSDMFKFLLGLP